MLFIINPIKIIMRLWVILGTNFYKFIYSQRVDVSTLDILTLITYNIIQGSI